MAEQPTVLGIYLAYIDDYLRELKADSLAIFRDAGIEDPAAIQPGERFPLHVLTALQDAIKTRVGRPEFFLELGTRIPITAHGNLGAAIFTCPDVRAVLGIVQRYAAIVLPAASIVFRQDQATLEYRVAPALQPLGPTLLEPLITTIPCNLSLLAGQPVYPKKVYVSWKRPPYAALYRRYTRCEVEFDADADRMEFSRSQLDLPIRTANTLSQRFLVKQCEDELRELQTQNPLTDRIREIVSLHIDTSPSIRMVAGKLGIPERTLRRRLSEEGVSYRNLLKQIRHAAALHYLGQTDMRIERIALRLGYRETASFRKAFKEISGKSPRQWREARR
ncbi:MAG: AraC family transcriptional regulator ligand-binding domain-containing protein [Nevskia sp.]|nr:AraC family transcriptional regulator ligand-binding domain-containing protein [Nevskia sp.]